MGAFFVRARPRRASDSGHNSLLPQAGFGVLIATVSVPQLFIIMT
jgi:hypothetical protein